LLLDGGLSDEFAKKFDLTNSRCATDDGERATKCWVATDNGCRWKTVATKTVSLRKFWTAH